MQYTNKELAHDVISMIPKREVPDNAYIEKKRLQVPIKIPMTRIESPYQDDNDFLLSVLFDFGKAALAGIAVGCLYGVVYPVLLSYQVVRMAIKKFKLSHK